MLPCQMIAISLNCLLAEYDLLRPKIVLLTGMAGNRLPGYKTAFKTTGLLRLDEISVATRFAPDRCIPVRGFG
ncbi:hypothetical protein SBA6_840007 [Candidatus Sulfopaludibacter sp. SbA6]|nr:hypothetical protein SBA6_840007 [Candidatus Sulfopaludibacter sp. SbA6]